MANPCLFFLDDVQDAVRLFTNELKLVHKPSQAVRTFLNSSASVSPVSGGGDAKCTFTWYASSPSPEAMRTSVWFKISMTSSLSKP